MQTKGTLYGVAGGQIRADKNYKEFANVKTFVYTYAKEILAAADNTNKKLFKLLVGRGEELLVRYLDYFHLKKGHML